MDSRAAEEKAGFIKPVKQAIATHLRLGLKMGFFMRIQFAKALSVQGMACKDRSNEKFIRDTQKRNSNRMTLSRANVNTPQREKRLMKKILLFVSAITLFLHSANAVHAFEEISPAQAYALVAADPSVYVLDVRTPTEWVWTALPATNSHDEGTDLSDKIINIPYLVEYRGGKILNENFLNEVQETFQDASITFITMCKKEERSKAAAALLEAAGYNVLTLKPSPQEGNKEPGYRKAKDSVTDRLLYSYNSPGQTTR